MSLAPASAKSPAALLARDYGIRVASAQKILALASGKNKTKAMEAMDLEKKDLAPLARYGMPSGEAVRKIAKNLGESQAKVDRILRDFVTDMERKAMEQRDGVR